VPAPKRAASARRQATDRPARREDRKAAEPEILPASKEASKVASKAGNWADKQVVKAVPAPQAASRRPPEAAPVQRLAGQAVPAAQQHDLSRASPAVKVAKAARVAKVDRLAPRAVLLLQVAAVQVVKAALRVRRARQGRREQVAVPATPVPQLAAPAQEPAARAAAR
jgi:hypothetical protein